jgi:hypothetical protein
MSRFVPRPVRRLLSPSFAELRAWHIDRDLAAIASGTNTIVAGPWLGEVGFELLYWVPFLAWFAERFQVEPGRLVVVSRGGTASWYRPFAAHYREIFDSLTPEEFRQRHHDRVLVQGEQKQREVLAFEHHLLQQLAGDIEHRRMLHPSTMFGLFNPFWWGHVNAGWVHRRARFRQLERPEVSWPDAPTSPYTAVKFYFNDCFPATEENLASVSDILRRLVAKGPVVSLTTGLVLDDHGNLDLRDLGVHSLPAHLDARENLAVQTAIVAGASEFIGTYGGFSYLAPFCGVRATAYYVDPDGFSQRHLLMAQSALRSLGGADLLHVQSITAARSSVTN